MRQLSITVKGSLLFGALKVRSEQLVFFARKNTRIILNVRTMLAGNIISADVRTDIGCSGCRWVEITFSLLIHRKPCGTAVKLQREKVAIKNGDD